MRAGDISINIKECQLHYKVPNLSARFDYRHTVDVAENLVPIFCLNGAQCGKVSDKEIEIILISRRISEPH